MLPPPCHCDTVIHTAISYYRQAIQLVPDIEHRMCYNDHTASSEGVSVSMVAVYL